MAYRDTLLAAKDSELQDIAGSCPSSARFLSLVNQAQQELARRGNWFGTEWVAKFCFTDGCLTWPRWVGTVLGMRWGRGGMSAIENSWASVMRQSTCSDRSGHWPVVTRGGNMVPTLTPVYNPLGSKIRYHVVKNADVGKTIRLHGTFFGGQPLQEKVDGVWRDGLTITSAKPFAQTSQLIRHITSIVREATQGPAYLYEVYDEPLGLLRMLNAFDPDETNPRYRTSIVSGSGGECKDEYGRCISSVEAMVKLQYIPVADDRDFMFFDREVWRAVKLGIQAIKFEDANDFGAANGMWTQAVQCLNLEDRNKSPYEQIVFRSRNAISSVRNVT